MVVRIGTWNPEKLFKPPREFAPKTAAGYDVKLHALAAAITAWTHTCRPCRYHRWPSSKGTGYGPG